MKTRLLLGLGFAIALAAGCEGAIIIVPPPASTHPTGVAGAAGGPATISSSTISSSTSSAGGGSGGGGSPALDGGDAGELDAGADAAELDAGELDAGADVVDLDSGDAADPDAAELDSGDAGGDAADPDADDAGGDADPCAGVDIMTDIHNCGMCGNDCGGPAHQPYWTCQLGGCVWTCGAATWCPGAPDGCCEPGLWCTGNACVAKP